MKNVIKTVGSDTVPTPNFSEAIFSSKATGTTSNKLVDSEGAFTSTVKVGDIVYNYTDGTSAFVSAIDSDTQLSLSVDIMASNEVYKIHRSKTEKGYKLHVGGAGAINATTAGGQTVVIGGVPTGETAFEVVHLFATGTAATDLFYMY